MLALLMLAAVLLSSVIDQLVPKVSSPLIQIALGLAIALLAQQQINIRLDPELFLVLFIAPLLFDEAKNVDKGALWRNRRPVLSLAVGLVIVTAVIIGFSVNLLLPVELAVAIALGAALGPTDAVAVASLSKETDLSPRAKSILEGESLINDASGIVAFQFALAAAVTGSFSLVNATTDFLFSFFGGIAVGLVLGYLGNLIVRKVRSWGLENTTFHVLFEVFTPFIVYLAGDALGTSGILAVVAAGLVNVISPRTIGPSISRMNIVSTSVWRVVSFALNGVVFVLLGTQLPRAMQRSWDDASIENGLLIGVVLLITFIYLAVRFLWLLGVERVHDRSFPAERRTGWRQAARSALTMALAGPKGTITLAVIFTIPFYLPADAAGASAPFPQRDLVIFLACGVIVVTLLLATFVVPLLAPKKPASDEDIRCDETQVSLQILRSVIEELASRQTPETRAATQVVLRSYNQRVARIKSTNDIEQEPNIALRLQAVHWEQELVEGLINREDIYPLVGYQYLSRLGRIENMLRHHRGRWSVHNFLLRARAILRSGWHRFVRGLPGASMTERTQAVRDLQIRSAEHVSEKLRAILASPEADVPAEDVSALLLEYQRAVRNLKNANPSITAMATTAGKAVEIERLGLRLELEQIQTRYEKGELCRSSYKRLRENVYLMQVDLEDNV